MNTKNDLKKKLLFTDLDQFNNKKGKERAFNKLKRRFYESRYLTSVRDEIVNSDIRIDGTFISAVEVFLKLNRGFLISALIFIGTFLVLFLYSGNFFYLEIAIFIPFAYLGIIRILLRRIFLESFAVKHGFKFEPYGAATDLQGRLFSMDNREEMSNILSRVFEGFPIRIFNYQYTTGSGKNSKTKPFTVAEISFEKLEFPFILLQSKKMRKYTPYFQTIKNETQLPLDKDFGKSFMLYAADGYETEIFQIFSQEILIYLRSKGGHFSIEFSRDKLYIYDDVYIKTERELNILFETTKKIISNAGPLIQRLHDDFDVLHTYYKDRK